MKYPGGKLFATAALALGAVLVPAAGRGALAATHYYVSPDGNDANSCTSREQACQHIQTAVVKAPDGATIEVAPGTYQEQVRVTKNLRLQGAGKERTFIEAPAVLTADPDTNESIVTFRGPVSDTMFGFTVEGPYAGNGCADLSAGIAILSGAALDLRDSEVNHIYLSPFSNPGGLGGCQTGDGIRVGSPRYASAPEVGHATIRNVMVAEYQKNGITITGPGSSGTVRDSVVTGKGAIPEIAQNGIIVTRGATATIRDNEVSGNECNNPVCGPDLLNQVQSTGIGTSAPGALDIESNHVFANDIGIDSEGAGSTVSHNKVDSNRYLGMDVTATNNTVTNNDVEGTSNVGVLLTAFGSTPFTNLTFSHNSIEGASQYGVWIDASSLNNSLLDHNQISDNGSDGIFVDKGNTGNLFQQNEVNDNGHDGIHVGVGSSGNTFSKNHMENNSAYDAEDDSAPSNTWTDNHCDTSLPPGPCAR